ncbi:MAG: hypothetical protein EOO62_14340 [Hymenobacter sp.]|nr:MAG: hypothetical protein EOO62_14340 [Hymenobacter sp.]
MVDILAAYCAALQHGLTLFDALARIYEPDAALDWASRTLMQISNQRVALTSRLAKPMLTVEHTLAMMTTIDRYLDSHWADYLEFPKPDPTKRTQVLELHKGLTTVINEVGPLYNTLRKDVQAK